MVKRFYRISGNNLVKSPPSRKAAKYQRANPGHVYENMYFFREKCYCHPAPCWSMRFGKGAILPRWFRKLDENVSSWENMYEILYNILISMIAREGTIIISIFSWVTSMFTLRKLANKQGHISNASHKFILNTNLVLLYSKYVIERYMIKPLVLSRLYIVAINVTRNFSWIFWWRFVKEAIWPLLSRIFDQNLLPWYNRK